MQCVLSVDDAMCFDPESAPFMKLARLPRILSWGNLLKIGGRVVICGLPCSERDLGSRLAMRRPTMNTEWPSSE